MSQARGQAKHWDRAAQPPSSLLPGGGHATTCPPPSGHRLASRWEPSPAPATPVAPARRGPLGRAPPARPGYEQLGSVGGWFCASLSGAPPSQPLGVPAPRPSRTRRTPPCRAGRRRPGAPGQPPLAPGEPRCARWPRQELGYMLVNWFHYQPPSASRVHGSNLNWSLHLSW